LLWLASIYKGRESKKRKEEGKEGKGRMNK
jgi:hypothetical protein